MTTAQIVVWVVGLVAIAFCVYNFVKAKKQNVTNPEEKPEEKAENIEENN